MYLTRSSIICNGDLIWSDSLRSAAIVIASLYSYTYDVLFILVRSMQDLLDYDGGDEADVFCLNFSVSLNVFGEVTTHDLIPNGQNISVTHENK